MGWVDPEQGDELDDVYSDQITVPSPQLEASDASRQAAAFTVALFDLVFTVLEEHSEDLGRLDAVAGDGDHGLTMSRGAAAALSGARAGLVAGGGLGAVVTSAATAWAREAGGTSGVLWGALLGTVGERIGNDRLPSVRQVADAVGRAYQVVTEVGGAKPGDRTMVDGLVVLRDALARAADNEIAMGQAWRRAAELVNAAAFSTAAMVPMKGRARTHGSRSVGFPDPGATSFAIIVSAIADFISAHLVQPS
jgi:dihydroxyacetone kinase